MLPFCLYIPLDGKNLKSPDQFSSKYTASRLRRRREIGRIQELFPAPCRREESLPEAFSTTMVASSTMCFMFRSCELPYMIKIIFV
jgi:hypothetical protein